MKKDQYFPHEANLRQTSEFMHLIEKEGMAGYGIYWGIIEYLRSQDNYIGDLRVLKSLSAQMRTSITRLLRILKNYGLFELTDYTFQSSKLITLMKPLESKRKLMDKRSSNDDATINLRNRRNSLQRNRQRLSVRKCGWHGGYPDIRPESFSAVLCFGGL